jgi:MoxR-like ATPase
MVNAALQLRRPLLITGKPGTGKSSLAYAVAWELELGPVLTWPITSRTTLSHGLYSYDALGRLQAARPPGRTAGTTPTELPHDPPPPDRDRSADERIGDFLRLGPLGTALLPYVRPRVLLIDEIDKSDIDLPGDLLNVFEEGEFVIPELARLAPALQEVMIPTADQDGQRVPICEGRVRCRQFPLVLLTSNAEREFPAPFLRRCLRLDIAPYEKEDLEQIINNHFRDDSEEFLKRRDDMIEEFLRRAKVSKGNLATDQLLNALAIVTKLNGPLEKNKGRLIDALLRPLQSGGSGS